MINSGTGDNLYVQYRRSSTAGNSAPGYASFDYLKIRTTFVLSNGLFQYFRNGKLYYSLSISEANGTDEDTIKIFGTGTYIKLFGFHIKHYDELKFLDFCSSMRVMENSLLDQIHEKIYLK